MLVCNNKSACFVLSPSVCCSYTGNESWHGSDLWDNLWDDSMQEERNRAMRTRRMNRGRPAGPTPAAAICVTHGQTEREELTYVENQHAMAVELRVRVPGANAAAPAAVNTIMTNDQTRPMLVRQYGAAVASAAANSGGQQMHRHQLTCHR